MLFRHGQRVEGPRRPGVDVTEAQVGCVAVVVEVAPEDEVVDKNNCVLWLDHALETYGVKLFGALCSGDIKGAGFPVEQYACVSHIAGGGGRGERGKSGERA